MLWISYQAPAMDKIWPYFHIRPQPDLDARFEHILLFSLSVTVYLSHKFNFFSHLDNLLLSRSLLLSFHILNLRFILDNNIMFAADILIVMIYMMYTLCPKKSEPPKHFATATANLHRFK